MADNTKRTLYLIIIFLLLLTNIIAGYFWLNKNKETEILVEEKTELQSSYDSLEKDLDTQMAELEVMKGKNDELDKIILEREKEIKAQQSKISTLLRQKNFTKKEFAKAKDMISILTTQNSSFMFQIDSLNKLTEELQSNNTELQENLSNQKNVNSKLESVNEFLDKKFELGSLLRAEGLKVAGIKTRPNGVEKELIRIKPVEKLRVCFETGNNSVREAGEATMYLRLITPNGQTLYNEANGSGTFKNDKEEEVRYSKKAEFDFDGSSKNLCIYWKQDFTESGEYKAMVYSDGYLIGESAVTFK